MPQETKNQFMMTEKKKREIAAVLNHFYASPVAKTSLELFLTIALVLFLAVFAIKPTIVTMSDLIKEIETKTELDEALTRKSAALQTVQSQYMVVEQQLPLLDFAIPTQPEVILSVKIIEKIAADSQIIMRNLNVGELPKDSDPTTPFSQKEKKMVYISASVTGDYLSIRAFVEGLRNSRKSFVVESVVFSLEEDRGSKKLNANVAIATPYFGVGDATAKTKK